MYELLLDVLCGNGVLVEWKQKAGHLWDTLTKFRHLEMGDGGRRQDSNEDKEGNEAKAKNNKQQQQNNNNNNIPNNNNKQTRDGPSGEMFNFSLVETSNEK